MKKKQILAALLAATCVMSLSVPASAASLPDDIQEKVDAEIDANGGQAITEGGEVSGVDVETSVQKPTLAVVLPQSVQVFVNPYRAEVATHYSDPDDPESADAFSIDTVVSPEMKVSNFSTCAVKVGVKGIFVTYQYVSSDTGLNAITPDPAGDATGVEISGWSTLNSGVDQTKLYVDEATGKLYYAKETVGGADQYRLVTVKATAANTSKDTPASYVISGYTASKNIKVGTAAIKDEDTEKTNTIFMYVEGRLENDSYASGYVKTVAGVKDTKTGIVSTTGQYALAAKEGSGAVLYLESDGVGYMRVTGNAATSPTIAWSTVEATEGFETPFVFTIDPVANPAEAAPELTTLTGATTALTAGKFDYTVDVAAGTTSSALTIAVPADVTVTPGTGDGTVVTKVANTGTTKVTATVSASATSGSKGTYTFTLTSKYGKVSTYTITVNVQ